MPGQPLATRRTIGSLVPREIVEKWLLLLREDLGSDREVAQALADCYGPSAVAWARWIIRMHAQGEVQASRADQIWSLLQSRCPGCGGDWHERAWFTQPIWRIVELVDPAHTRAHYYVAPGKARAAAERFGSLGRLVEITHCEPTWATIGVEDIPAVEKVTVRKPTSKGKRSSEFREQMRQKALREWAVKRAKAAHPARGPA